MGRPRVAHGRSAPCLFKGITPAAVRTEEEVNLRERQSQPTTPFYGGDNSVWLIDSSLTFQRKRLSELPALQVLKVEARSLAGLRLYAAMRTGRHVVRSPSLL
jgi:hypothetical protein